MLSFVTDPIFQKQNLIDIPLSIKASLDLSQIIESSGSIYQNAKKLSHAAQ